MAAIDPAVAAPSRPIHTMQRVSNQAGETALLYKKNTCKNGHPTGLADARTCTDDNSLETVPRSGDQYRIIPRDHVTAVSAVLQMNFACAPL